MTKRFTLTPPDNVLNGIIAVLVLKLLWILKYKRVHLFIGKDYAFVVDAGPFRDKARLILL